MLNKLMGAVAAGAAVLSCAGIVFAQPPRPPMPSDGVSIENDKIMTTVKSNAIASTGDNLQYGKVGGTQMQSMPKIGFLGFGGGMFGHSDNDLYQKMSTGDAYAESSAYANVASTLGMPACALCSRHADVSIENEHLMTFVSSKAVADTGDNTQTTGSMSFRMRKPSMGASGDVTQKMYTGDAAAFSDGSAFVGYTDFSVTKPEPAE